MQRILATLALSAVACTLAAAPGAHAQQSTHTRRPGSAESRASLAFAQARRESPLALHAFLQQMPKGADLHMHLSGAIYAETMLDEAARDGVCIDVHTLAFDPIAPHSHCKPGEVSGPTALERDNRLRDALIDSFSMRGFVPSDGVTGHDHFFATFGRFGGLGSIHTGDWLDAVATRAAAQNEQYLEIMDTPNLKAVEALAEKTGYNPDFRAFREELLRAGFDASLAPAEAALKAAEQRRNTLEHCDAPAAQPKFAALPNSGVQTPSAVQPNPSEQPGSGPQAACQVAIRFLFQVLREQPPVDVFAQVLFAFELARADPSEVVGLNLVQPEDGYLSMRDYRLQMSMLDALHSLYPGVHISLHAGELAPGLVPPAGLSFHIRSAVEQGHAERIGHGVDLMYEDHPWQLLHEMTDRHILVEINLTSNAVILGISGPNHPLPLYLKAGVPVALSTDDEGVSRIDLTHEYVLAAETYGLTYRQLKQIVRASIDHSFLPGPSLWQRVTPEDLTTPVPACRNQLGNPTPEAACATLVQSSEKATQQWELERRFHVFEQQF